FDAAAKPPEILLELRDEAIQAAPGYSETTKRLPRLSGLPRAFGPRNDEGRDVVAQGDTRLRAARPQGATPTETA
ncbi:MAG: hypothetical protein LBO00_02460, partial [Zoogloeaceae bacterium]|nr:hypothetical protein [Zoogloeaceae bacterium]